MFELTPITVAIAAAIGTATITLIFKVFEKGIDTYFDKWKLNRLDQRELAHEVIKIHTEGSNSEWYNMPADYDKYMLTANEIEGFDPQTADELRQYLAIWYIHALKQESFAAPEKPVKPTKDDKEFCKQLREEAQGLGGHILKTAHKWKR